jgi:hypothetical protein
VSSARGGQALERWARDIAQEHGLDVGSELRRTTHDLSDRLRNVIWEVTYQGRPAVLKVYDDDEVNLEAASLRAFQDTNRSTVLTCPKLYLSETVSLTRGWLVIEKLPDDGHFFESPLEPHERGRFVELFCEYRRHFPREPNRPLALAESQDAFRFHSFRLMQALETASTREQQREFDGQPRVLENDEILPRLERVMTRLSEVFTGRDLHWGHGHFRPSDVYEFADGRRWALTDFGHTKMLPEGYEPALAIWADQMIVVPTGEYDLWRRELDDWSRRFLEAEPQLVADVLSAGLLERSLSTVLESITTEEDLSGEERSERLRLHYRLMDDLT